MSYKTYDEYKESKMSWIDKIPSTWDTIKAKHCFNLSGGYAFKSDDFTEEGIPLVRIGDITNGTIDFNNCKRLPLEYATMMKEFLVESGDILIALTGATIGKIGQVPKTNEKILLNQRVGKLSSDLIKKQINLIADGSAQENISNEDIGNFEIFDIDNGLKQQIANYLDKKTAKIDATIAKNEELIELLEEKRVALINQVVTKGLNPDVPMKDSGVEWIGEIPKHWNIINLKKCCETITDGSHFSPETTSEGKYYITVRDVSEDSIDFDNAPKISVEDYNVLKRNGCEPKKGDVLLSKDGTIGKCIIVNDTDFVILSSLGLLRPNNLIKSEYLRYYLLSDINMKQMYSHIRGSAIKRLTISIIKELLLIHPSLKEQEDIVNYLNPKIAKINDTINKIKYNINLLEEYKTSLIHHVVTGKIDVRGEEI